MKVFILISLFISLPAFAISLKEYTPYKYEVLFTNPVCKTYYYPNYIQNQNGDILKSKTPNAYCKSSDSRRSAKQKNGPHTRLIEWIKDKNTKDIFLAYLSFSKTSIAKELCRAIKYRNTKITIVIDSNNESDPRRMATVNLVKRCRPNPSSILNGELPNIPVVITSGNTGRGRDRVGYAHNKLFFVNPNSTKETRIAYSSGNMSAGTVTHHENWHFITTSPKSFFSQIHKCLMKGVLEYDSGIKEYSTYIAKCRQAIIAQEESDIKVFIVPGEGPRAFNFIKNAISKAKSIEMAAHRFSNSKIINAISIGLKSKKSFKLLVDDDLYYTGVYRQGMGRNSTLEYSRIRSLKKQGLKVKYIETYADDIFEPKSLQLQHNKFLIFHNANRTGAVFSGAGNLTTSAFTTNFENFYYVSIPEVYQAFKKQYQYMWNKLARSSGEMPTELILP